MSDEDITNLFNVDSDKYISCGVTSDSSEQNYTLGKNFRKPSTPTAANKSQEGYVCDPANWIVCTALVIHWNLL
jgi:hypothetical protein